MPKYFVCIFVLEDKIGEDYMPPLEKNIMSETYTEIKSMLSKMQILHDSQEEKQKMWISRQEMWERLIKEQTTNNKERLELMERQQSVIDSKWSNLRGVVITVIIFVLGTVVSGGIIIPNKTSREDVGAIIKQGDYASKSDVMRGTESVIDDVYGTFERETDMTHDEAYIEAENVKMEANRKITNYNPRSIK